MSDQLQPGQQHLEASCRLQAFTARVDTEPPKGHAKKFLPRAHEIASRAHEIGNFFCMTLRGLLA